MFTLSTLEFGKRLTLQGFFDIQLTQGLTPVLQIAQGQSAAAVAFLAGPVTWHALPQGWSSTDAFHHSASIQKTICIIT